VAAETAAIIPIPFRIPFPKSYSMHGRLLRGVSEMEEGCERDEVSAQLVRKKGTGMAGMVANNKK